MINILITGCGSGLGRAAAIALANRGHFVYATTHTEKQAYELNKLNEKWCLPLLSFKLDITCEEDRIKVSELDLDVLINNAAIGDSGPIAEIDVNKFRNTFETNVFSTLELTQLVLKKFIEKKKGRIIFVSSLFGRSTKAFLSPYCATKFAIEAIAPALNKELKVLKDVSIPIIMIEPGAFSTGFNEKNISKQFNWIDINSSYSNYQRVMKFKQQSFFKLTESTNVRKIVQEYINAVEDNKPKLRYVAPKLQGFAIKCKNVMTK